MHTVEDFYIPRLSNFMAHFQYNSLAKHAHVLGVGLGSVYRMREVGLYSCLVRLHNSPICHCSDYATNTSHLR